MSKKKFFSSVWDVVIWPAILDAFDSMDEDFKSSVSAKIENVDILRYSVERAYKALRYSLKQECYGDSRRELCLDSRKLGAIICKALINVKCIRFDIESADEFAKTKKDSLASDEEFNKWAVSNILVNYKIAYLASVDMVFVSSVYCLANGKSMMRDEITDAYRVFCVQKLCEKGRLYSYPNWVDFDSFGVNMIIALARLDINMRDLDLTLYALQLWQHEMYTLEVLKRNFEETEK